MREGAGGVPGLDLLPEDELQFPGVFFRQEGEDGGGEGEEHFCGILLFLGDGQWCFLFFLSFDLVGVDGFEVLGFWGASVRWEAYGANVVEDW